MENEKARIKAILSDEGISRYFMLYKDHKDDWEWEAADIDINGLIGILTIMVDNLKDFQRKNSPPFEWCFNDKTKNK